jgi:hypothetical protein
MSERPTDRLKRLGFPFLIQYVLGLVVFPGVAAVVRHYTSWATARYLVTNVLFDGGFTVVLLAMSAIGGHWAARMATARGLPQTEVAVGALRTRIGLGASLAVPPFMAVLSCGWGWAVPFYVVYILYGVLMVRMLRRLEKAAREAQNA